MQTFMIIIRPAIVYIQTFMITISTTSGITIIIVLLLLLLAHIKKRR